MVFDYSIALTLKQTKYIIAVQLFIARIIKIHKVLLNTSKTTVSYKKYLKNSQIHLQTYT